MILEFPPKKPPAPERVPALTHGPQGWPPGLRTLVEELRYLDMPSYPIAPSS